jgi:hypothetical protein
MTTELNPSPAPEPQGAVQAPPQNGAQTQNQQGQHSGQGQGHRRRRRRRNKNKGQQNGAPPNGAAQNGQSSQAPAQHQGQGKQKSGKRFFQKNPGNQGGYNGNGFRPMPGNGNGGGGRRKNKGRRQQVFVGPMDHSYRASNGNVADPVNQPQGEFRGVPHSGFYSEADFYQPVPMRDDAPTRIYCFIEDLFFLAKIQEVSKKLGIKVALLKPDKDDKDKGMIAKLTETSEEDRPALILFDLNNANAKPLTLIPKIRAKLKRGTSIIGFLSHIQGDLKNKALEAGCDTVMPRATFSQNLPSLLRRYGTIEEEEEGQYQVIQA